MVAAIVGVVKWIIAEMTACTCTFRLAGLADDQHQDRCAIEVERQARLKEARARVAAIAQRDRDEEHLREGVRDVLDFLRKNSQYYKATIVERLAALARVDVG